MNSCIKIWVTILMIAGLAACGTSKKSISSGTTNTKVTERLEDALLWKIEAADQQSPSYLFGTIHLIGANDFFYPEGLLSAIDDVERITFEIDINDMMDMSKQLSLMQKAFMRDNLTLKDLLTAEEYQMVKAHFDKIGIPLFFLERMQPMFLSVFGYGEVKPGALESGEMLSYEFELNKLAKQQGKSTAGLETVEYQLGAIDSIPYEEQAQMLVETIRESDKGADQLALMIDMYTNQRIDDMYTEVGTDSGNSADFEKILLTNRNKNWIPVMSDMMKEGPTLFAVGAGHLGGPHGVIRLLRQKGYKLSPISMKE